MDPQSLRSFGPGPQELAAEDRLIDSKTVEAEYAEQVSELTRPGPIDEDPDEAEGFHGGQWM